MAEKITKEQVKSAVNASADDFENPNVGETFGGSYPRIELSEGQVSPLLTYIKDSKVQIQNDDGTSEMVSSPVVQSADDNKLYTLPISAIFRKHWGEANVNEGDTLKVKRYVDAIKKRGKGAGNKLRVFAVKVYSRAAAPKA